jgi:hypothetical protein
MRAMAEKDGMHMSLEVKRRVKARLPRGTDASSIWLMARAWVQAKNAKNTLRRSHRVFFQVLPPYLPRVERERR